MIRYTDIISLRLFGGGGLVLISQSVVTLQLEQFFAGIRAGAHCVSKLDILRDDFWKLFTTGIS